MQPPLPILARIRSAIDLEMRIALAAYDNHDDVLVDGDGRVDYVLVGGYAAQP